MTASPQHPDRTRSSGDPPTLAQALHGLLEDIAVGTVGLTTAAERRLAHRLRVAIVAFDSGQRLVTDE